MTKYIIMIFILIYSIPVWADCGETPEPDLKQKGVTEYEHAKIIFHSQDGKVRSRDSLTVWKRNPSGMCFSIMTISNEYRTCYLEGEASLLHKNEYTYTQNECRASFTFKKDKVLVKVIGSRGNFCVAEDLGEDNGCGTNTSIDTATYIKSRKKRP